MSRIARFETYLKSENSKTLTAIRTVSGLAIWILRLEIAANRWRFESLQTANLDSRHLKQRATNMPFGVTLVAPYCAILRYYRCDTPYRAILSKGGTLALPRNGAIHPPLKAWRLTPAHLCDTPFCSVSRDNCVISHKNNRVQTIFFWKTDLFRRVFSSDSRESRDSREPPTVENKGKSDHFLEILEIFEILQDSSSVVVYLQVSRDMKSIAAGPLRPGHSHRWQTRLTC